jgi:hypothetical protein
MSNYSVIGIMNLKVYGMKQSCPVLRYYPTIFRGAAEKNLKILSEDSWSLG